MPGTRSDPALVYPCAVSSNGAVIAVLRRVIGSITPLQGLVTAEVGLEVCEHIDDNERHVPQKHR